MKEEANQETSVSAFQEPAATRRVVRILFRASLATSIALGLACVATAPPLEPQYEALVDRSRNLEGLLNRYATVTGNKLATGGKTTFKAFFKPSGLIIVHATTAYENGDNRVTNAYYDKAQPFYTIARTTRKFEGDTELQIFFDATGKLTYSRFQKDGALAPMPEGEAQQLVRRTRDLASDAIQARGPGHKIGFDLGALNELGLTGPPLRSIQYRYCIPANEDDAKKVQEIDRTAQIDREASNPCGGDQWQATCETHQAGFRKVLMELATLPFVKEIQPISKPQP